MTSIRIAPNNPVFDLPVIVGIEEGLFVKAGLDVSFSGSYADREQDGAQTPVLARLKEQLFECGSAESYIVVQELTGSHYTTLQMLESAVGREHVRIENSGLPQERWAGLKSGAHRAVTVMEPFISLGLKEGAHVIASCFYRGGEVVAAELTGEQRKAYYDAENAAVDLINADFYKYAHHVTAHAKGALQPRELLRAFVRYKHVDYYDPELFNRAYEWMKARGMTEGQSQHAALIVG